MTTQDLIQTVVARQSITDALARYCRGIDRCDVDTLKSAFWPDAVVNYGADDQDALAWSDAVVAALKTMERTQHAISNILIELDGDTAAVETYCRAYHALATSQGPQEMMVGGRYLDRFARRGDDWKILRRQYVMDWNQNGPATAAWSGGLYEGLKVVGARYPADPLYTLLR